MSDNQDEIAKAQAEIAALNDKMRLLEKMMELTLGSDLLQTINHLARNSDGVRLSYEIAGLVADLANTPADAKEYPPEKIQTIQARALDLFKLNFTEDEFATLCEELGEDIDALPRIGRIITYMLILENRVKPLPASIQTKGSKQ
jgi:hypothetical protein